MTGRLPDRRGTQARILRRLSAAGGELPAAPESWVNGAGGDLAGALADLERGQVVRYDEDAGTLRFGARGSKLDPDGVETLASVGSTNDAVLEGARAGADPGLTVAAELQTAGRGRRGRSFDSRPGLGLWVSRLLPVPDDATRTPRLALLAGLAVAEAVAAATGRSPRLKWPNDVLLDGRKIAGILVEARTEGRRIFAVAGIGLNVHHRDADFPAGLVGVAGSVQGENGSRPEREALLGRILAALDTRLAEEAAGRLDLSAAFAPWDALLGREVEIAGPGGAHRGTADGIESDGGLRLRAPDGTRIVVRSGEATVRPVRSRADFPRGA